jgi:hypothetical protein
MPGIDVPRETSADRGGHVAQVGTGFSREATNSSPATQAMKSQDYQQVVTIHPETDLKRPASW